MDRNKFNELLINGTEDDILRKLVEMNPEAQGYQIARDVLNYRNTKKLVKTTWWLVWATWIVALVTVFGSAIIQGLGFR